MQNSSEKGYPFPLKIIGLGRYAPQRKVLSSDLESQYGLEIGWCFETLGIRERRWVEDETASVMGAAAATEAIAAAGLEPDDIDLIINASMTTSLELLIPDGGAILQQRLGLGDSGIPCFTIRNNDVSFLSALHVSANMLILERYETILIVSSEIYSTNLDLTNPHIYTLFGDGAAAAVVTLPDEDDASALLQARFETYGENASSFQSLVGLAMLQNTNLGPHDLPLKLNDPSFMNEGITHACQFIETLMNEYAEKKPTVVIPQQIGKAFLLSLSKSIPEDILVQTFEEFGYCGSASIPMALYDTVKEERLRRSDVCLLSGFGAGLSLGAIGLVY